MKRVLISLEKFPPDFTGAGLRAYRYSQRMNKKWDFKFLILTQKFLDETLKKHKEFEITKFNLFFSKLLFPFFLVELLIRINLFMIKHKDEFDIIHMYSSVWLNKMLMLSNVLFYHKKMVYEVTLLGADDPTSVLKVTLPDKVFAPIMKRLFLKIDQFVVQNEKVVKSCLNVGISKEKIWMRPNPIDEEIFGTIKIENKIELRKKLNLPKNKFIMLNVGRFGERKNQLFLLKCLKELKNKNYVLLLIGPTDFLGCNKYFEKIKEYIKENNLEEQVLIVGRKENINEYMVACDLLTFSSLREGFPNVIQEAMISGLPSILFNLDGIKNFINKDNGIIVEKKNKSEKKLITEFQQNIEDMYSKKINYNNQKIRQLGIKYFSAKKIDKFYYEIYEKLLK
jgi:glycosyltransferase involved in cell wall biosynthesis